MIRIGVQTHNIIDTTGPDSGFALIREAGFSCVDFSLNGYLKNKNIYRHQINHFFDKSVSELETFFLPYNTAAAEHEIAIHQMHMPYPIYVPYADEQMNRYLMENVAPKSIGVCSFLGCRYLVVHGFKLAEAFGSEQKEWEKTRDFLMTIAPIAQEKGVILCLENLYNNIGGHLVEGPCTDADLVAERIDRMNEQAGTEVFGFCFDTGHANLLGIDMESFITKLGPRLKVLHIHDNDGKQDLHQIPYTFTKTRENAASTDWDGFIQGLINISYDGVLSFETAPVLEAFPVELKMDALKLIARIGRYFADGIEGGGR